MNITIYSSWASCTWDCAAQHLCSQADITLCPVLVPALWVDANVTSYCGSVEKGEDRYLWIIRVPVKHLQHKETWWNILNLKSLVDEWLKMIMIFSFHVCLSSFTLSFTLFFPSEHFWILRKHFFFNSAVSRKHSNLTKSHLVKAYSYIMLQATSLVPVENTVAWLTPHGQLWLWPTCQKNQWNKHI